MRGLQGLIEGLHAGGVIEPSLRGILAPQELGTVQRAATILREFTNVYVPDQQADARRTLGSLAAVLEVAARRQPEGSGRAASGVTEEPSLERVGSWIILGPLAEGGQGETMLVRHHLDGTQGVMKRVLPRRLAATGERARNKAQQRLIREIECLQSLEHVFIMRLLDRSPESEREFPWMVTEFLPVGPLQGNLAVFKGDFWRTLRMARDLAAALGYAHDKGHIHRDLKPSNVLLRSIDHPVLADFGLVHTEDETSLTDEDEKVGGRWYRPPEAELGHVQPTPAFDVYSLGKLIYEMLTNRRFATAKLKDPEVAIHTVLQRADLSPIHGLIERMLEPDPAKRIANMTEVVTAIDRALAAVLLPSAPTRSTPETGQVATRQTVTFDDGVAWSGDREAAVIRGSMAGKPIRFLISAEALDDHFGDSESAEEYLEKVTKHRERILEIAAAKARAGIFMEEDIVGVLSEDFEPGAVTSDLSAIAAELLLGAARGKQNAGLIFFARSLDGVHIAAGDMSRSLTNSQARELALHEEALEELSGRGYVRQKAKDNYGLTSLGFTAADSLAGRWGQNQKR